MNLSKIILFLLQGGAGAVSGYITNKYAVNMLFKEYTPFKPIFPFKFGGVIKNRKEEFIEEISELVERDIINSETILSNVDNIKLETVINSIVKEFFNIELKKSLNNMKFNDINNFNNIQSELFNNFKSILHNNSNLIDVVLNELKLSDEVTRKLLKDISKELFDKLEKESLRKDVIEECVKGIYENISNDPISNIVPYEIGNLLEKSIVSSLETSLGNLFSDDENLVRILNDIYEKIDIETIIGKLQDNLYHKHIYDFINEEELVHISSKIFNIITSYINSKDGNVNLNTVSLFILNKINDMDYTIYDILPEDTSKRLTEFIDLNIHKMMPYLSQWIEINKDEFDTIIEKSIDEAIGNLDPGIKKMIISKVRELFLDNISAKNEVVKKITDYIENYNIDENSLNEISNLILNYLKNTKISEMFMDLKNSNIVDNSSVEKFFAFLKDQFNVHGEKIIYNFLKSQSSKTVGGDIIGKDLFDVFNENIKDLINRGVIDNKDKLSNIIISKLRSVIHNNISELENSKISEVLSENSIDNTIEKVDNYIEGILKKNKDSILNTMSEYMQVNLLDLNEDKNKKEKIFETLINHVQSKVEEKSNDSIYDMVSSILCTDNVYEYTSKTIKNMITENLDSLLRGKIKEVIKNNLKEYEEDEICDLAQRFMGNELKPLSLFGGVLGFICGIIFGFFFRNVGVNGFYDNIGSQILSVLLMGIVGVLTNVIAINMLFKPYTKNKFLAKIPFIKNFALGYIPAHKENISKGIGNVIDNDLLNQNYIVNLLKKYQSNIKMKISNIIGNDNFRIISEFITSQKDKIINAVCKTTNTSILDNKNTIVKNINMYIGNIKTDKELLRQDIINDIIEKADLNKKIQHISQEYIDKIFESEYKVKDIITPQLKEIIEEKIKTNINESCINMSESLLDLNLSKFIGDFILDKLGDNKISAEIETNLSSYLIRNGSKYVKYTLETSVNKIIDKLINDDNTLETAFYGKIKIYIDKNLFRLTEFAVDKVKVILINNEELISESVKFKINESLNFFEKIGYAMAGGDEIVNRAVNIMIEKNLPVFINDKFFEITSVIKDGLDNSIYTYKIKDICPYINHNRITSAIDYLCESLDSNEQIRCYFNNTTKYVIHNMLCTINKNSIENIINKFTEEISIVKSSAALNIRNNKVIANYIVELAISNVFISVYELKIKEIFNDYHNIESNLNMIIEKLNITDFMKEKVFTSLKAYLNNKCIEDIINTKEIEKYLNGRFDLIVNSLEFNKALNLTIEYLCEDIINNGGKIIDEETKLQICDKIIEGSLNSIINNSNHVIQSINLKEITENQIKIMNPKELHELFISFSGPLFKKLYLYGAFGSVFGINLWIPVILGIKESINISNIYSEEMEETKKSL